MKEQHELKLFLDFDNTIANSSKAMVLLLNGKYGKNHDYRKLKKYDFTDFFPELTQDELVKYFESEDFFNSLEYLPGFKESKDTILQYSTSVVTSGSTNNLDFKHKWLHKDFDFPFYQVDTSKKKATDKSDIDMSGGIFVDDHIDCLRSSNAKIKILIKNDIETSWNRSDNRDTDIYIVNTWTEIREILDFYLKVGMIV